LLVITRRNEDATRKQVKEMRNTVKKTIGMIVLTIMAMAHVATAKTVFLPTAWDELNMATPKNLVVLKDVTIETEPECMEVDPYYVGDACYFEVTLTKKNIINATKIPAFKSVQSGKQKSVTIGIFADFDTDFEPGYAINLKGIELYETHFNHGQIQLVVEDVSYRYIRNFNTQSIEFVWKDGKRNELGFEESDVKLYKWQNEHEEELEPIRSFHVVGAHLNATILKMATHWYDHNTYANGGQNTKLVTLDQLFDTIIFNPEKMDEEMVGEEFTKEMAKANRAKLEKFLKANDSEEFVFAVMNYDDSYMSGTGIGQTAFLYGLWSQKMYVLNELLYAE
jgi:hypothetical protein